MKHIRRSSNLYNLGQEIQMDAAFATWYGNKARALHLAVDKATKKVLYGWFDIQETTRGYYIMLMNIIIKYGIPKKIKTDKRGTFSINNAKIQSNLNTTQFGRICKELEITLKSKIHLHNLRHFHLQINLKIRTFSRSSHRFYIFL